jgi:pyrimidine-specific ribonucleoside hydrolase
VRIELAGTWTRGQTIVDRRAWVGDVVADPHGLPPADVDVALGIDGDRARRLFLDTVAPGLLDPGDST